MYKTQKELKEEGKFRCRLCGEIMNMEEQYRLKDKLCRPCYNNYMREYKKKRKGEK